MKKFFALLLSLAMVLALVACGQKEPTPDTPDTLPPTIPSLRSSTRSL